MGDKERLKALIREAGQLLENRNSCHTRADRDALADMIARAERALKGEKVPFTRNREFFKAEEDQEILERSSTLFGKGPIWG